MYRHDTIQYNRFLSRDKTKAELIDYLTAKTPEYCTQTGHRLFFRAYQRQRRLALPGQQSRGSTRTVDLPRCPGITVKPTGCTNGFLLPRHRYLTVIVLVIANCDLMRKNTSISMASGDGRIEPIWKAIGAERAKAFPVFHAFTGADNTGLFSHRQSNMAASVYEGT